MTHFDMMLDEMTLTEMEDMHRFLTTGPIADDDDPNERQAMVDAIEAILFSDPDGEDIIDWNETIAAIQP